LKESAIIVKKGKHKLIRCVLLEILAKNSSISQKNFVTPARFDGRNVS